ncbi:hypothetical protein R3P38DRAFT_2631262 [Favolaschia claudopus]|uniref:Reverse transcriptase zinc-binding domain-containing protein n=1 Tax=Favolaschia claudopus TaxID=2862362 RepID=A0AAW0B2I7_9AGAR
MFTLPGMALQEGTQRVFNKYIIKLKRHPARKSTTSNLDRARCCIRDEFGFLPPDTAIWTSIRSTNISRLTRNFLWKCLHDTFHIGTFWDHVQNLENFGVCTTCQVPETMEHITLDCYAPARQVIWSLAERLWRARFKTWPTLNWGLLIGCALPRFKSKRGKRSLEGKDRFFTILVSTSMHLIWKIRNERVLENKIVSNTEVHNRWLSLINAALKRDQLLTNKARFGSLAKKPQLVLETWSGVLHNEDSLPDNWLLEKGVLVGIRPISQKIGVG